ncbi:MAG: hypothetical protein DMG78_13645 [Acidobacteria bacterium]|nr:MAG: hypothetical protein DMG78_13645 [Acidobacteriota bacterium]
MDVRAAQTLTSDNELFYHAFNASPIGITLENLEGRPLFANRSLCSMLGFTEEELRGKHCADFSPPEDAEKDWALFQQLRAGSINHYQLEKRYFRSDGSLVWGRLSISLLNSRPTPLVVAMVEDITDKKTTEEALRSSEERLKIFVKHVPAAVAMLDCDMRYLQVSDRWCVDFRHETSQLLGRSHYEMFPDIPDRWKEIHRRALAGETLRADEDRWDREGGTAWLRWEIRPWKNSDGLPGGILIFSEDITHRKNAEEALLGMSRKLVEAHEQERTRIGRDLHDDIVQRLALLAIELEGVQHDLAPELSRRIDDLRNQATQITNDVQLLSHELHSSKLEYLGIVGAIKNFCREYCEHQKLEIDFKSHDLPAAIPSELSLSLFRVLQEALRNGTKHSGVKSFEVKLWGTRDEIHLTVRDSGVGFHPEAARGGRGLGLVSMEERLKLLNGTLTIESQPKSGTTIHARVPFSSSEDSMRAAG